VIVLAVVASGGLLLGAFADDVKLLARHLDDLFQGLFKVQFLALASWFQLTDTGALIFSRRWSRAFAESRFASLARLGERVVPDDYYNCDKIDPLSKIHAGGGKVALMDESVDARLVGALRARGGRVTPQRLAIAQLIRELDGHATAEEIFGQLTERLPGVSRPTVYATLELLEELGQVVRVPAGSGAVLFDPRTDHHDHMVCRRCGAVSDLDSVVDVAPAAAAAGHEGFAAEDTQLVVRGLCADCQSAALPSR